MAKLSNREVQANLAEDATERYRDFSQVVDPRADASSSKGNRNERSTKKSDFMFPSRLHYMLSDIDSDESMSDIIRWQPHGRGFVILDRKRLESDVLPLWFNQTKIESFFKQLNLYGFKRINFGRDKGCYYHELFLRGKPFLAEHIKSKPGAKTNMRVRREPPEAEPDFFSMPVVEQAKSDPERVTISEGAHSTAEGTLLPSGEVRFPGASGVTDLESIPAAVLQELNRRNTAQAVQVHYLNAQTAYPAFPPMMAVGPPMWLRPNGQATYASAGLTLPAGPNSLGGNEGHLLQPLGPVDVLPQQIPVFQPGTNIPPYVYATVPVAIPGMPLFYGQGAPHVESLKMPFHHFDANVHGVSLPDATACNAPVALEASTTTHGEMRQEQGLPTVPPGDATEALPKETGPAP